MKKYYSLGELLTDFRQLTNQTQSDLAAVLSVDVRTIARWEKNESLINPDKLADVVEKTFIPYQVVHNLNAPVPLPIYYDFRIRKYSLTSVEKELPDSDWFRKRMQVVSQRVRPISNNDEVERIMKYHRFLYQTDKPVSQAVIKQAVRLLPEFNFILYDTAGFYAGHYVVFPLAPGILQKLRNREMVPGDLREAHLVNPKTVTAPVFFGYSIYADCNENFYYLAAAASKFIETLEPGNYTYCTLVVRPDALELAKQIGLKKIWEDKDEQVRLGMSSPPTYFEGAFNHAWLRG